MVVAPQRNILSRERPEEDHSHDVYTVANVVTVLRLILVPFFFSVMVSGGNDVLAFSLFAIAASTDWLDGQIARRTGTVTVIGKAIDPMVDRLLLSAGVLGLYIEQRLPLWILVVLFARDIYLGYGAWVLEQKHLARVPVTFIGKVTTAALLVGFSDLILNWPRVPGLGVVDTSALPGLGTEPVALGIWLIYVGIALSMLTAFDYTRTYLRQVSERSAT